MILLEISQTFKNVEKILRLPVLVRQTHCIQIRINYTRISYFQHNESHYFHIYFSYFGAGRNVALSL